jgi:hypothetical protein
MRHVFYRADQSQRAKDRKRFKIIFRFLILILIVFILAVIFVIYTLSNISRENSASKVGKKIVSYQAGPKLYKNQYFEFYSSDNWTLDKHDSTNNMIMYVLYQAGVVAGSFQVYVNQTPIPNNLQATMALPVKVAGNHFSYVGNVSQACGSAYHTTNPKRIEEVNISSTSMLCVPDSSEEIVIAGQIGGNYDLSMLRGKGVAANYIIIYRSSSFTPSSAPFSSLMSSFKAL